MRMTKHRMRIACALLTVAAIAGVFAWRNGSVPSIVPPNADVYLGLTREQIIDRLGPPDNRWPGNYGLPDAHWASQVDPCETYTYVKWHGTLYISVYQKNGQWVCFSANWLPKGAVY